MSITVTISAVQSPIRRTLRRWDIEQSPFTVVEIDLCGRIPPLLTKPHGLPSLRNDLYCVECDVKLYYTIPYHTIPTDFFVASHWLERSSCRFAVTLLVFRRADHSTSPVLTTSHVGFVSTFTEGLLQKAFIFIRPLPIGPTAVTSHAAVNNDAHSIQISSQNIRIRR